MDKKDVFISYKTEEFEEAEWVRSTLENNGVSCWMAPASIPGGSSYAAEIPQAIRNCKVFVLILSEKTQLSKWVPRELDQAINEGKTVLPFMLENCTLKDDFNFYLSNIQRYEAFESKTAAFERMLRRIKALLISDEAEHTPTQHNISSASVEASAGECEAATEKPAKSKEKTGNTPENGKSIPDIPEILKEKEQPKKKSKKPQILISLFAVLFLLIVVGVIFSALNTVEIAGKKYKTDDTGIYFYGAELSTEDMTAIRKLKSVQYISMTDCKLPDTDLSWITTASTLSFVNCGLTDEHIASIDFSLLDLTSIELDGNSGITDLSVLSQVADTVTTVSFNSCSVSDISFVNQLTKLYSFYADSNGISDISALSVCKNLQVVSLNNNNIDSIEALGNCTQLSKISINNNNIDSIEALGNCTRLSTICVNNNKLSSLNGLESAIRLKEIYAGDNNITNIDGLKNATILKDVSLKNNPIFNLDTLVKSAAVLSSLDLEGTNIISFSPIGELVKLKTLTLDNCRYLTDLDFLKNCTALESFSASNCSVTSLDGIENCTNLTHIDLSNNRIDSLGKLPFGSKTKVYLDVSNNRLTEVSLPEQNFSTLSLYGNSLSSLDIEKASGDKIIVGYCESFDYSAIKGKFATYTLIDFPLDKHIAVSDAINSLGITFMTQAEYIASLNK